MSVGHVVAWRSIFVLLHKACQGCSTCEGQGREAESLTLPDKHYATVRSGFSAETNEQTRQIKNIGYWNH